MKRIGVDLHGVISDYPKVFKIILEKLNRKCDIHILSGPPTLEVSEELLGLGYAKNIHYNHIFSVVDYLKSKNVAMWKDHKNTWWSQDNEWWKTKGEYCKEKNIELLIDNSSSYQYFLPEFTEFILINNKKDIDNLIKLLENIINEIK